MMQQILPEFVVDKKMPNQKEGWCIEDPREQLNKHFVSINSHYGFIEYMQEVSARSTLFIRILKVDHKKIGTLGSGSLLPVLLFQLSYFQLSYLQLSYFQPEQIQLFLLPALP